MGMSDDQVKLARSLQSALREHLSFYGLHTDRSPLWYRRLISELVLLIDTEKVQYVTGVYQADSHQARVVVFTSSLVIDATAHEILDDAGEVRARAVARCAITSLSVEAPEGVFSTEAFSNWPGRPILTATYPAFPEPITAPLDAMMNGDQAAPVLELLASLRQDLAA